MGSYSIGGFTFKNTNLTPVKTVAGTKVWFTVGFHKASTDEGIGNVKLTVKIKDTSGKVLASKTQAASENSVMSIMYTPTVDLKAKNKKIQIWFDASSTGDSNGKYRSITIDKFISKVE